ncbi:DUF5717 family protein [Lachnospiraceae bacterium 29-84]
MHKKIEEMAAGICGGSQYTLKMFPEQLIFEVVEGKDYIGGFSIESPDGSDIQGIVYSSSPRLECRSPRFRGEKITQTFEFHSEGLIEGDKQEGNLHIICSLGEYDLPFSVSVSKDYAESSMGRVKSIFEFANLARNSMEEAVRIFGKPEFLNIFKPQEEKERLVYQTLMRKPCTRGQVEEFLVAAKKKDRVSFEVEEAVQEFTGIYETQKQYATLKKDGWGHIAIEISSDVPWIRPVRELATAEEFVASRLLVEYMIVEEELHPGKNFGRITFRSLSQKEQVEICVVKGTAGRGQAAVQKQKKQLEIVKAYLDLGMQNKTVAEWAKQTGQKLDELHLQEPGNPLYPLAKAQVFFANGQRQEAARVLDSFPKNQAGKDTALYAYYLYLRTLQDPEASGVERTAEKVRRILQNAPKDNFIFWILLFLEEGKEPDLGRKLRGILQQVERGGASPVLYREAYCILEKEPYLMSMTLDSHRNVLYWAAKQGALTREVARQVCRKAKEIPVYHLLWYRILASCYEIYPERAMLQVICSYCMKWDCYGERYFKWYQLGVEEELRIAGLYEAWVQSAGKEQMKRIPKSVVMYFQYHSSLPYRSQALLYQSIIEHKLYWKAYYPHYRKNIEEFTMKWIRLGKMDRFLAPLCQEVLTPELAKGELADCLSKVLFTCQVSCSNPNAAKLVLRQHVLGKEQVVPICRGVGYVPIYGSSYQAMLEDARGRRFLPGNSLRIKPLLQSAPYVEYGMVSANNKLPYLLKYFDKKKIWQTYEEKDLPYLQMLLESEEISSEYRSELHPQIFAYYYDNYKGEALDRFLLSMPLAGVQEWMRQRVMELLVARRHYGRAYELLLSYGCEHIPPSKLVYVACHRMDAWKAEGGEPDGFLLGLCRTVFLRGKYNEQILEFMCSYFSGSLEEMVQLWRAACDFGLDTYSLEERCIEQFLYTGSFFLDMGKIFQSYAGNQGQETLVVAYLSQMSHLSLTRDAVVKDDVFCRIFGFLRAGQELNGVCRLGFLKWCSRQEALTEEETHCAETVLKDNIMRGIWFSFYKSLPGSFAAKYLYHDRVFLEYHAEPGAEVVVDYLPAQGCDYVECKMKEMYSGVFVKMFIVFYGESIPYYIKEKQDEEWILTESGHVQDTEFCTSAEGSRYDLLNDMMVSRQVKDEATLWERLDAYGQLDAYVKEQFCLI